MGKNKRQRLGGGPTKKYKPPAKPIPKHLKASTKGPATTPSAAAPAKKATPQKKQAPIIPFSSSDRILLIGDGDLSFAASLVSAHGCGHVVATVQERNRKELEEKYPHVGANVEVLEGREQKVVFNVDAGRMGVWDREGRCGGGRKRGGMDRVIFNFPHVGGKSTDVNRQVRYNQELLVNFFKRAIPSLTPGGSIIVTLFEGMPYTLWNIRDLARHSGLAVERSFKFQASAYPGYHHARTIGVVKTSAGEVSETGWKGEERPARSYVFIKKDEVAPVVSKRKRGDDDSDEEEEEAVEGLSELEEQEEEDAAADHSEKEDVDSGKEEEDSGSEGEGENQD
ncbi:hypothetical protein VE01_02492 [Pseudogymnoascus verrucosus]|uniref:25S rRNA (uridine-N(3))-methyltransferase BMT5-like domain-containing protein n=1 Tax=Pseudogymnoascus verrucosus TaxID=342668 RepID=A0A1B8GT56_9PEZI|nr:uncharacterized protein VE01_02492 [Pseudogymnoascus verrucosus]OBT99016.1 hypothetical protein VE01_02492 [Pseudogymnoascus verrucosus]